jgi:hypothetical protein
MLAQRALISHSEGASKAKEVQEHKKKIKSLDKRIKMFRTSLQKVKQADDSDDSDDEEEAQHFQKLINEAEEKKRLLQEAHDKAVGKQTLKRKRTVFGTKITKKAKYMDEYEHRGLKKKKKKTTGRGTIPYTNSKFFKATKNIFDSCIEFRFWGFYV